MEENASDADLWRNLSANLSHDESLSSEAAEKYANT